MSKNSKVILRYDSYQSIIQQYLLLAEFKDKAADTMNSKRLTIMELCNYLGDNGIHSFHDCQQKHVSEFLCSISALATSTISGKTFILRHFSIISMNKNYAIIQGRNYFLSLSLINVTGFCLFILMRTLKQLYPASITAP